MQSALAAKQQLFAHVAITDVRGNKLWHDQRIARWSGATPDAATPSRPATTTANLSGECKALLHPDTVGWDWIGINLMDGSALTAFRLRDKDGHALWDGGSYRSSKHYSSNNSHTLHIFELGEVQFSSVRTWGSLDLPRFHGRFRGS
jgi:predicted secreted hydrolase